MRWLKRLEAERGASAVLVGLLLVPLLAAGALAVDVGALYSERGQLQNGADAAAMAVATNCNTTPATCLIATQASTASSYATGNMISSSDTITATITSLSASSGDTAGSVTVQTFKSNMQHPLAAAIGIPTSNVSATATAVWGGGMATLPFVIGTCEDTSDRIGKTPPVEVVIDNTNGASCSTGGPGGFGWINNLNCSASIAIGDWVNSGGATGSWGSSSSCTDAQLNSYLCTTLILPIFDITNGLSGTNLKYHVSAFAGFVLDGWAKNPGSRQGFCPGHASIFNTAVTPPATSPYGAATWPKSGFQGHFVAYDPSKFNSTTPHLIS